MIEYTQFELLNGLRVVHNYDAETAMVAVDILYNVGARDERDDRTGLAHLMEHLMFGGSVNVPDFDAEMERAGGSNNAWTSNDFTNFYDIAPAVNLDTLLWLESDRMTGLAWSEKSFEVQRSVVTEEFKQTHLNRPYGDLGHRLRELLYTSHPYRYPTIGKEPEHIARVSMEDVREFFYTHYAPNNAVLAISGNVTLERAREAVERWFGNVPKRDVSPRLYCPEPEITAQRSVELTGHVPQPLVVVAYPMAAYGRPGYVEADLLTDILASGRSSRMYRELTMGDRLFTAADASIAGSEEPGFIMLKGRLTASDTAEAIDRLNEQLTRVAAEGVEQRELERAQNRFESNFRFSMLMCAARAQELAQAVMHGEDINRRVELYRSVTTDDIRMTAAAICRPERMCTVSYVG